jgi:probable rRNA maturation factor
MAAVPLTAKRSNRNMAPDGHGAGELRVLLAGDAGRPMSVPGLARWLQRIAPVRARGCVSVALVGDARVRALNKRYRKRDYATDVLSFSYDASDPARRGRHAAAAADQPYLGDIVIARGVARRQAREAGHSERTEFRILALHGLLHLLGYDHERDRGAMARVERALRRKGGLPAGLLERGHTAASPGERRGPRGLRRLSTSGAFRGPRAPIR